MWRAYITEREAVYLAAVLVLLATWSWVWWYTGRNNGN